MTTTWPEQLPPGTEYARHTRCGRTYSVDDDMYDVRAGKLCCEACEGEELGSGYGFVPVKAPTVSERTGGEPWQPVPCWLLRGERVRLEPLERALILALWGYQGGHTVAWPSIATLAGTVGRGDRQVRTVLNRLVARRLVDRWRPSARGGYRYDVRPLIRGEVPEAVDALLAPVPAEAAGRDDPLAADDVVASATLAMHCRSLRQSAAAVTPAGDRRSEEEAGEVETGEAEPAFGRVELAPNPPDPPTVDSGEDQASAAPPVVSDDDRSSPFADLSDDEMYDDRRDNHSCHGHGHRRACRGDLEPWLTSGVPPRERGGFPPPCAAGPVGDEGNDRGRAAEFSVG